MKIKFSALFLILALAATGCGKTETAKKPAEPKKLAAPASHSIKKTDKARLLKDAKSNLDVVMAARDETTPLAKALTGQALKAMGDIIIADKAAGRVKIRRYDDLKLSMENYTAGIAGIAIDFTDNSTLVEAGTDKVLQKASGKKMTLLLALKKIEGRWMIFEIFSKEVVKKRPSS